MTNHAAPHFEWVQHGSDGAQDAAARLPHLWRESIVPVVEQLSPEARAAIEALEADAARRVAEIEARAASDRATAQIEILRWRGHAQAVEAEARARGHAEGYAAGASDGRRDAQEAVRVEARASLDLLAQLAGAARVDLRSAITQAQATLADLSQSIAAAIIGEAFVTDQTLMARRIAALLDRLADGATATVRLHPADLDLINQHWSTLAPARGWRDAGPRFVADAGIAPGGCVIEARAHYLDARIETLSALVRDAFTAILLPEPEPAALSRVDPDDEDASEKEDAA